MEELFLEIYYFIQSIVSSEIIFYSGIAIISLDHAKSFTKLFTIIISRLKLDKQIVLERFLAYKPEYHVLIPAYNSKKVENTLQSLMDTRYQNMKIIVIVNGPNQHELYQKIKLFIENHMGLEISIDRKGISTTSKSSGLQIILEERQQKGKAAALNFGIECARRRFGTPDFVVTLDADSKISNLASFNKIAETFVHDKDIIAISADIQVSNGDNCKDNIWTKLQTLEYLLTMHIGKRFHTISNTMLIIPGGFAIFRSKFLPSKPFDENIITEDFVLSLNLHALGKKIVFEPYASAKFDTPNSYAKLNAQRIRWACGQMQTLRSFRHIFTESCYTRKLKISVSNMWIFDVIFNIIWVSVFIVYLPIVTLLQIESVGYDATIHSLTQFISFIWPLSNIQWISILILFYLVAEYVLVFYAIRISGRKECLKILHYVPLLVFFYRPLLRISVFRGHMLDLFNKPISWEGKIRGK